MFRYLQIVFVVALVVGAVAISQHSMVSAATASELRQQIEERNAEIRKIEEEIKSIGKDIVATSQQRLTLESKLREIEAERQHLLKELELTSTKIERTDLTINGLNGEISDKEERIENQKKGIAMSIKQINEYDQYSVFELILAPEDESSDFWREIDNLLVLQNSSKDQIHRLLGLKTELRSNIAEKQVQKKKLQSLKEDIEDQKQLVERNKSEQAGLVSATKNKEESYKQLLAAKEAQRRAFEQEIREYESQLVFLENPGALPKMGTSPLSWPLDSIVVTQLFGAKTGPHRTYANGHSGVDFRARTPQKVYAMADGVVMGTGDTDIACRGVSFGRWVTIKYDNNLVSTFGHLSLIKAKAGDRVKRGEIVGYSGNTGRTTAPHLHVSLYAGIDANGNNPVDVKPKPSISCKGAILTQPTAPIEAYLDPLEYLPKVTKDMLKPGIKL